MSKLKRRYALQNNRGVILLVVTTMTIILSILAIATMSITVSQNLSNQQQIVRIKAEQLAKGAFWYSHMGKISNNDPQAPPAQTLDSKTFTANITVTPGTGPNGEDDFDSRVNY